MATANLVRMSEKTGLYAEKTLLWEQESLGYTCAGSPSVLLTIAKLVRIREKDKTNLSVLSFRDAA